MPVAAPFAPFKPFATSRADSSARDGVADVAGRRVHAPIRFLAILLPLSEPAGRERGNAFKLRTERKRCDASLLLPLPYEGRYESTKVLSYVTNALCVRVQYVSTKVLSYFRTYYVQYLITKRLSSIPSGQNM